MSKKISYIKKLPFIFVLTFIMSLTSFCFIANARVKADDGSVSTSVILSQTENLSPGIAQSSGDYKGIKLSGSGDWSAEINAVFKDDASITFALAGRKEKASHGISVKNAKGEVVATLANYYVNVWQGQARAFLYNALENKYYKPTATGYEEITALETDVYTGMQVAPTVDQKLNMSTSQHTIRGGKHDATTMLGTWSFEYDKDAKTLTAKVTTVQFSSKTDNDPEVVTVGVINNVDLSDGYTLTMHNQKTFNGEEKFSETNEVLITAINGVDMSKETLEVSNGDVTDLIYEEEKVVAGKNVITIAQGSSLNGFAVFANFKIGNITSKTTAEVGRAYYNQDDFATRNPGEYQITVSHLGFEKAYTVIVKSTVGLKSEYIVEDSRNVIVKTSSSAGDYTGLMISRANDGNLDVYAKIEGVFTGNTSLTYLFYGSADNDAHAFSIYNSQGVEVMRFINYYTNAWQLWGGRAVVYDTLNGKYYTAMSSGVQEVTTFDNVKNKGLEVLPTAGSSTTTGHTDWGVKYDIKTALATTYFEYDEVNKVLTAKTTTPQRTALSDGADGTVKPNAPEIVTVGSINVDLTGGYTIAVNSQGNMLDNAKQFTDFKPLLIQKIDGVVIAGETTQMLVGEVSSLKIGNVTFDLSSDNLNERVVYMPQGGSFTALSATAFNGYSDCWSSYFTVENVNISGEYDLNAVGSYVVTVSGERNGVTYSNEITLTVEPAIKITLDENGGSQLEDIFITENNFSAILPTPIRSGWKFLGWFNESGDKVEELTSDMQSTTLKAEWLDDVNPVISLNGINDYIVIDKLENFNISSSDIIAEDYAWGKITEEDIQIFVKKPNAEDYVEFDNYSHDGTFGEYLIKYKATDGSGNSAELIRTVKFVAERPVLTIDGEVVKTVYTGSQVTLPTATANSGNAQLTVTITVTYGGEQVNVENGKFTADQQGTYFVVYSVTDDNLQTAVESFEIVAQNDVESPVINVEFNVTQINQGQTLELPVATATDNCDGTVQVTVQIKKGEQVVANSSTVLTEEGVYTVIYTATDKAGNVSTETFEVVVATVPTVKGCNSDITTPLITLSAVCLIAVLVLTKRKIKKI